MNELTLREEYELSDTIVSLHPHKQLIENWKPKFYVIRKGWPGLLRKLNSSKK